MYMYIKSLCSTYFKNHMYNLNIYHFICQSYFNKVIKIKWMDLVYFAYILFTYIYILLLQKINNIYKQWHQKSELNQ